MSPIRALGALLGLAAAAGLLLDAPTAWPLAAVLGAAVLFAAASVSGRRLGRSAREPSQIDLLCGDVYSFSVFLAFLALGWMPAWMFFVLFAAEITRTYVKIFGIQIRRGDRRSADDAPKLLAHAAAQAAVLGAKTAGLANAGGIGYAALLGAMLVSAALLVATARGLAVRSPSEP